MIGYYWPLQRNLKLRMSLTQGLLKPILVKPRLAAVKSYLVSYQSTGPRLWEANTGQ